MALTITHSFATAKSDDLDTSLIRPADWNANHSIQMDTNKLVGRQTAGAGDAEEIDCTGFGRELLALNSLEELGDILGIIVGEIKDYAGSSAPSGYLLCYGQAISRTTYSLLFAAIGTTYGVGNGTTTFNLPDLRGRVVAGQDDMGGASANRLTNAVSGGINGDNLGGVGGSEYHQLQDYELAEHNHSAGSYETSTDGNHTHSYTRYQSRINVDVDNAENKDVWDDTSSSSTGSSGSHNHDVDGFSGDEGDDIPHNNVQPTFILNKIIFTAVF